jgi:hypothetical protein
MNPTNTPEADDFSDLGFDMEPHREIFVSFAKMKLSPRAVRPALRARDMAFIRLPSSQIALRLTADPAQQEAIEAGRGGIGFSVIHSAAHLEEAQQVRVEVERYFLRHFPGRTVAAEEGTDSPGNSVVIVCYAPGSADRRGSTLAGSY